VKIKFLRKEIILISCFLLLFSALTFAADQKAFSVQGKIEELNLGKNRMVVNEKVFVWGPSTQFFDERGAPITAESLKVDTKVSIEATWIKSKPYTIKKLSLLPE
jgi:hypothetical protein